MYDQDDDRYGEGAFEEDAWDGDSWDGDSWDGDNGDDDEALDVVPCPECGADVYEDAPRCPACGSYIVHETSVWSGRPLWWIVLGGLGILMTILALSLGGFFL